MDVMNSRNPKRGHRNLIYSVYKKSEAHVKLDSPTRKYRLQRGVEQDDSLSPNIFKYIQQHTGIGFWRIRTGGKETQNKNGR